MLMAVLLLCSGQFALASDITRGNQLDAIMRDSAPLYEDQKVCARVAEVGQKVVTASGNSSGFTFHFYVLNTPEVTAFSVPGGDVYVTTGLLRHLTSEDELAVVLGHEIAHINERHLMKTESAARAKTRWTIVLELGIIAASAYAAGLVAAETASFTTQTVGITASGQLIQSNQAGAELANLSARAVMWGTSSGGDKLLDLYFQGYKDEYEFASDRLAMQYADKAGYDGGSLVKVLERLSGNSPETGNSGFSHLHSSNKVLAARIKSAQAQVATAPKPAQ